MLTDADDADVCCRMLPYAAVCWHMRTYADYVLEITDFPRQANSVLWDLKGTQFTCFASTKVQILTLEELRAQMLGCL